MAIEVNGKSIELDEEGYLTNLGEWSEEAAKILASQDEMELTDNHWEVIHFLRDYYDESDFKLLKLPNSVGISPVSWLSFRERDSNLVKLPNSVGISPVSWLLYRESFDTCPPLQSTPSQLQGIFVTFHSSLR
ncbi:DsrC-like protein, partial [Candidatus Thiomargarita nelsonii]